MKNPKEAHLLLSPSSTSLADFPTIFADLNTLLLSSTSISLPPPKSHHHASIVPNPPLFSSTTLTPSPPLPLLSTKPSPPSSSSSSSPSRAFLHSLPLLHRSLLGAAAGGIAGAFTYLALLPIDAVKTLLQTRGASTLYSSAVDAALHIFRTSGPLGFYRGASAVVLGSAISSSIYFGTCELAKPLLSPLLPTALVPPAAGASGNVISSAIMVPKELITQRVQAAAGRHRSLEVLLRILRDDGFLGLYSGYAATLLRNLPAGVLSYSSFEYAKAFVLGSTGQSFLAPAQSVLCGALAGAVSASLTTPLDVIKTRLMTRAPGDAAGRISDTVRDILAEDGWLGLTRGIGPRVLHSACFSAIGYAAFETARFALLQVYAERTRPTAAVAQGEAGR